jgi:uncharacterized membrane protein required for colicin V production
MNLNVTLLAVVILMVWMMIRGYKKGMAKELSGLVALFAAFVVLALGIMLVASFSEGEMTNTLYSVILLVVFGLAYGIVKFILRSAKAVSSLPIIHFVDSVLGIGVGFCKAVLFIWIFFMLCAGNYLGTISSRVQQDIAENTFLKLLYEFNFFVK